MGSDYCCIYVAGKYLRSLPTFTGKERAGRAQTGSSIRFSTESYLKLFNYIDVIISLWPEALLCFSLVVSVLVCMS